MILAKKKYGEAFSILCQDLALNIQKDGDLNFHQ